MSRILIVLVVVCGLAWVLYPHSKPPLAAYQAVPNASVAAPNAAVKARVSAASKAKGNCVCCCGDNCLCAAGGDCGCDECPNATDAARLTYAHAKAVAEKKPLLVWVRQWCACERSMPEYVHAHLTSYNGAHGEETDCEVIVGKPDGSGGFDVAGRIEGCPADAANRVKALLNPAPVQFAPMVQQPVFFRGASGCSGGS